MRVPAAVLLASLVLGCHGHGRSAPPVPLDEAAMRELGGKLVVAAAAPCDVGKVAPLFDRTRWRREVEQRTPTGHAALAVAEMFVSTSSLKLCGWLDGAVDVRLLRVRAVQGEARAVIRKVSATG